MAKTAYQPYARTRSYKHSRWYLGHHLLTFLATGEETGGRFSLIEAHSRRGAEPPPHVHEHEDECFYILDGELDFYVGGKRLNAKPGTFVVVPRGAEHTMTFKTDEVRLLILGAPAGLETFFDELSQPAEALTLPPPSAPDWEYVAAVAKKHGGAFTEDGS